jgi:hypothetical protein
MGATLSDFSLVNDYDFISLFDGAQSMGNDDHCLLAFLD